MTKKGSGLADKSTLGRSNSEEFHIEALKLYDEGAHEEELQVWTMRNPLEKELQEELQAEARKDRHPSPCWLKRTGTVKDQPQSKRWMENTEDREDQPQSAQPMDNSGEDWPRSPWWMENTEAREDQPRSPRQVGSAFELLL